MDNYYLNFYVRSPEYWTRCRRPNSWRSPTAWPMSARYCEMPLKILRAEELVGGEEAMDEILYGLFNRELDYTYRT